MGLENISQEEVVRQDFYFFDQQVIEKAYSDAFDELMRVAYSNKENILVNIHSSSVPDNRLVTDFNAYVSNRLSQDFYVGNLNRGVRGEMRNVWHTPDEFVEGLEVRLTDSNNILLSQVGSNITGFYTINFDYLFLEKNVAN